MLVVTVKPVRAQLQMGEPKRCMPGEDEEVSDELDGVTFHDHGYRSEMIQSLRAESDRKRKDVEDSSEDEIEMEGYVDEIEEQRPSAFCQPMLLSNQETNDASTSSSFNCTHAAVNLPENSRCLERERCTWSAIAEEANELAILHEKSRNATSMSNSEAKRARKDGKCKGKKKVSFLYQPLNRDVSLSNAMDGEEEGLCEDIEMPAGQGSRQGITGHSFNEALIVPQDGKDGKSDNKDTFLPLQIETQDRSCGYSISSLLGDLEKASDGNNLCPTKLLLNRRKSGKFGFTGKKGLHMGSKFLETDISLGKEMLSDDDADTCHFNLVTGENREHTMVDLFNVFDCAATASNSKPLNNTRSNYHARLTHLLQGEKDKQTEFSRQMQMKWVPNGKPNCFYVQILSRSFDARLIVCECLIYEKIEELELRSEKCVNGKVTKKTIIFRSKICRDVDLEVGNLICIYFPWLEMHVREGEDVILCTYFSQVTR